MLKVSTARSFVLFVLSIVLAGCLVVSAPSQGNRLFYDDFVGSELGDEWLELRTHKDTPEAIWPITFEEIDGREVLAVNIDKGVDIRGEIWTSAIDSNADVVVVELTYMVRPELGASFVPNRFDLLIMPSSTQWIPAVEAKSPSWFSGLESDVWYKMRLRADATTKKVEIRIVEEEGSFDDVLTPTVLSFRQAIDIWDQVSVRFLVSERSPVESGVIYIDNLGIYLEE